LALEDLRAGVRIEEVGHGRSEEERAHGLALACEDLFAEVVEDVRLGLREDLLGKLGGVRAQTRRLAQELERRHPAAGARMDLRDGLGLHPQTEALEQQRARLFEGEEKLLALDDVDGALGREGL